MTVSVATLRATATAHCAIHVMLDAFGHEEDWSPEVLGAIRRMADRVDVCNVPAPLRTPPRCRDADSGDAGHFGTTAYWASSYMQVCAPRKSRPRSPRAGVTCFFRAQFYAFTQMQYDVVVYVDIDTVFLSDVEPELSRFAASGAYFAAADDGEVQCAPRVDVSHVNTGVMFIRPHRALFLALLDVMSNDTSWYCRYANQEVVNAMVLRRFAREGFMCHTARCVPLLARALPHSSSASRRATCVQI